MMSVYCDLDCNSMIPMDVIFQDIFCMLAFLQIYFAFPKVTVAKSIS